MCARYSSRLSGRYSALTYFFAELDDFLEARVVVRVRGEHAVIDVRLAILLPRHLHLEHFLVLEQAHDVDHRLGLVADPLEILRAELVGLEFHVASVAADQRLPGHVRDVREVAAAGQDADQRGADAGRSRARSAGEPRDAR